MQRVRAQLAKMPTGQLVGYADFVSTPSEFMAVAAALSRLSRVGEVVRFSKGRYYRPAVSRFGPVLPSEANVTKTLGAAPGQPSAYPTGLAVYNALGLTTQVPATLTVATTRPRRQLPRRLRAVVRPAPERLSDVPLLQWLEVLRDIRRIPDTTPDQVLVRIEQQLANWDEVTRQRFIELALNQGPPRARALLGALLEHGSDKTGVEKLRTSLNPLTVYRLSISAKALPNRTAWNIR
jgi:hypothetical protein